MLEAPRPTDPSNDLENRAFKTRVFRCSRAATFREIISDVFPFKEIASSDLLMSQSKCEWKNWILLFPNMVPKLKAPEPDYDVGIPCYVGAFPKINLRNTSKLMGGYATPAHAQLKQSEALTWVLLTIEVENDIDTADRKSSLSSAIAVNNILQLKKRLGRVASFYNQGRVFAFGLRWPADSSERSLGLQGGRRGSL